MSYRLARWGGRVGRSLGPGLELIHAVGFRELLVRRREQIAHNRQWPEFLVSRRIWSEAARACSAEVHELDNGVLEIRGAEGTSTQVRINQTQLDDPAALQLALDKPATQRRLIAASLPVPQHVEFDLRDPGPALRLVEAGGSWVVKPAGGTSGGQGTTSGIQTVDEFLRASARVARSSRRQLLERSVQGDEYRMLVLDGELLGVVRRSPPRVLGDGVHTVTELVQMENRRRLEASGEAGLFLITLDLDALLTLRHNGVGLHEVPPAGVEVMVKTACSQAGRLETEVVDPDLFSPELVDEVRCAVEAVELRLAGIDLITPDRSSSLASSGGGIIEVNGMPGLHYHYNVCNPEDKVPVAVPILAKMISESKPSSVE